MLEERAVGGALCEANRGSASNPLFDETGAQSQDTTLNDSYSRGEDDHGDTLVGDGDLAKAHPSGPGKVRSRSCLIARFVPWCCRFNESELILPGCHSLAQAFEAAAAVAGGVVDRGAHGCPGDGYPVPPEPGLGRAPRCRPA